MRSVVMCAVVVGVLGGVREFGVAGGCDVTSLFGDATATIPALFPGHIAVGDFDGDGDDDLAYTSATESGQRAVGLVLFGPGDQRLVTPLTPVDGNLARLLVADLDADGRDDIVTARGGFSLRSLGAIGLDVPVEIGPRRSSRSLLADINGDQFPDLIQYFSGPAEVRLGSAIGFGPPVPITVDVGVFGGIGPVEVADVNGDGRDDIIAVQLDRISVNLATNVAGAFETASTFGVFTFTAGVTRMAVGDLNQDGQLDVFVPSTRRCRLGGEDLGVIALGDGTGRFPSVARFPHALNGGESRPVITDANADGRPDVLHQSFVFLGDGRGGLQGDGEACGFGDEVFPRWTVLDANLDGRPDIVATSPDGIVVYFNQCDEPLCPADLTTESGASGEPDGIVTMSDFAFYLDLWSAADPAADVTTDGTCQLGCGGDGVTLSDFSCYLTLWAGGCP